MAAEDGESPYTLHHELGALMMDKVGVVRSNAALRAALSGLADLSERAQHIALGERSRWANQGLAFARQVRDMIVLGQVVAQSALERDECRGAHFKPEFQIQVPAGKFPGDPEYEAYRERWRANNERWLETTVAESTADGPKIHYEPVDLSVMTPTQPRDYR